MTANDRELGMHRRIARRDFLSGTALTIGASLLPANGPNAQILRSVLSVGDPSLADNPEHDSQYYPPALTGMRGSHPGSFEVAHRLRDKKNWADEGEETDPSERYDLVVVGGGISGLAAAYFFRKAHGPGWVLLGDAHYKKDPCTAQGITDAFCDAERLAEAIDDGLSGKRPLSDAVADYERAAVEWTMPFYELTCQMATFVPPPPEMLAIYAALKGNQEDTDRFLGLITEATLPGDFFAAANVERILQRAQRR